jgi:hypothetical protein
VKDWIKHVLTKKIARKGPRGKQQIIVVKPDEKLVYGVKFAVVMTLCLTVLEIAHMAFLGKWNNEVFSVLTGLVGAVTGILIGQRA